MWSWTKELIRAARWRLLAFGDRSPSTYSSDQTITLDAGLYRFDCFGAPAYWRTNRSKAIDQDASSYRINCNRLNPAQSREVGIEDNGTPVRLEFETDAKLTISTLAT